MTKINVVAQAAYPIAVDSGRHLAPGESGHVDRTPRIDEALVTGHLREIPEPFKPDQKTAERPPRAEKTRDENQDN